MATARFARSLHAAAESDPLARVGEVAGSTVGRGEELEGREVTEQRREREMRSPGNRQGGGGRGERERWGRRAPWIESHAGMEMGSAGRRVA